MGIHPLALSHGMTREGIRHAVENAEATIAVDNGPTLILILGYDDEGVLIEASGVIREEDVLFVHAAPAKAGYHRLLETARSLPGAGESGPPEVDPSGFGWSVDGLELTDQLLEGLISAAEDGYDVDTLRIRLRTGRPAPLSVGEVTRLELEPSVYAECALRADSDGVTVHELIRRALRDRLPRLNPAL